MTDFIREVDEEVRQDRFKTVLDRYWYVIVAVLVLILGGVAAWKTYDYFATQKAEAAGGAYLTALDLSRDGKSDEAVAALKTIESDATPGYRLLARLRLAGETGTKDPTVAAQMFDAIGSDPAVDPAVQAVAKLRAALLLVDTLPYDAVKQRLAPLADPVSTVRNAAREMLALAAFKANDIPEAGRQLDAIESDATTGAAMRQRAEALLGLVHGAGPAPVAAAVAAPAPVSPEPSSPPAAPAGRVTAPDSVPTPAPAPAVETPTTPVTPPTSPVEAPPAAPAEVPAK